MKIAIHFDLRKDNFCHRWINYCEIKSIKYVKVNALENNIIDEISDCSHFLWHWMHYDYASVLIAKKILFSLEKKGVKVYPDLNTCFYFDDKLGQKYLFESLKIDSIPTNVFYVKSKALKWLKKSNFPIIFKLRKGAGSNNVLKVNNINQGRKLINKAFSSGFSPKNKFLKIKELYWLAIRDRNIKSFFKFIISPIIYFKKNIFENEKEYVSFQEFIPNNEFDCRVIIIGNRAISVIRYNRKNDFRASGSGIASYPDENNSDLDCIKTAFEINKKLNFQSISLDFIYKDSKPILIEVSYGFPVEFCDSCPGYWTSDLNWVEGKFISQEWIIKDLIS
tara:strand:+ start:19503 stop:20510 length:1008 start_codon:yes stop_codon:yes gene_type:complete